MADEPSLPNFQAAATEVTSTLPEPTRPEADYSRTGPGPDLVSMERWANNYNDAVQEHAQQRQPEPEVQQSEKQQALMEAAQALAPKENPNRDQQLEQQQQPSGREI
jgi:hypothetical protein